VSQPLCGVEVALKKMLLLLFGGPPPAPRTRQTLSPPPDRRRRQEERAVRDEGGQAIVRNVNAPTEGPGVK
jgi:hypothetical protein